MSVGYMRLCTGAVAALFLCGCASQVRVSPPPAGLAADMPVAAPMRIAEVDTTGPQMNSLGGEIPKSAPVGDVGEGGLGEATPDQD